MHPDSHKVCQNKQMLYSLSLRSSVKLHRKALKKIRSLIWLTWTNHFYCFFFFREILPYNCLVAIKMTGAEHQTLTSAFMANALWLKKYSMSPLAWNSIKWNTSKPTVANQAVHFSALTNFVAQRRRRSVITSKRIRSWIRNKAADGRVTA